MRRAEELAAAICKPIATSAGSVTIGVSIGLLVVDSWGGIASSDSLMHQADTAMFTAKARRRRPPVRPGRAAAVGRHGPALAPRLTRWRRYRHITSSPCSPTRCRPSANRDGANGAMSTLVAAPSRISSAIPRPTAGAVLNPVPLWPQSR